MKREKKAKQDHGTVFSTLCMVLFGAALGIFAGKDLFEIVEGVSFGEYLLHVAWLIVMMTAAFYLQTILHEGGHLVCGLLTGYRFVSFRIGSWMVQRENGRLRFHRYTLAGTAGVDRGENTLQTLQSGWRAGESACGGAGGPSGGAVPERLGRKGAV